jgi:hypothetical protein
MGLFELDDVDERVKKALVKNQNNPEGKSDRQTTSFNWLF